LGARLEETTICSHGTLRNRTSSLAGVNALPALKMKWLVVAVFLSQK
jgi:hypothetical protein